MYSQVALELGIRIRPLASRASCGFDRVYLIRGFRPFPRFDRVVFPATYVLSTPPRTSTPAASTIRESDATPVLDV
jgi:hypothetical protein